MATSKKRLSDDDWRPHESAIRRMIVEQNKSREETRLLLKDVGFLVTQGQLEFILKKLGIRKKVPKKSGDDFWQFIGYRVEKRKRHGKASEVILNNQILNPAKVRREISRHQPTSLRRFTQGPTSPRTPDGLEISIYTPVSIPLRTSWPSSLPWLRCQLMFSKGNALFALPKNIKTGQGRLTFEGSNIVVKDMLQIPHVVRIKDTFNLANEIGTVMPETFENENTLRAQILTLGPTEEAWHEYIKIVFYRLSNNIGDNKSMVSQWTPIVKLLLGSGFTKAPIRFNQLTDRTVAATAEKLFQNSLQFLDYDTYRDNPFATSEGEIINWLLSSGQNPDCPLARPDGGLVTPLQHATQNKCSKLAFKLLDSGAKLDLTFDKLNTPLQSVILNYRDFGKDRLELVKRLLKEAALTSVDDSGHLEDTLHFVLTNSDTSFYNGFCFFWLIASLIHNGADIFQQRHVPDEQKWFTEKCNAIGLAAGFQNESNAIDYVLQLLEKARKLNKSTPRASFITTDVVLRAAAQGNRQVLELLRGWNVNINDVENHGISALYVAAYYGHTSTCSLLLEDGTLANRLGHHKNGPSALHLVAHKGDLTAIDLLCRYGDDVCDGFQKCRIVSEEPALQSTRQNTVTTMFDRGAVVNSGQGTLQPRWWELAQSIFQNNGDSIPQCQQATSMIEAAGFGCNRKAIEYILARTSGYDHNALCASIYSSSATDITITRKLMRRHQPSTLTMDLEALAIGIAAWHNELELLDWLLAEFQTPALAAIPHLCWRFEEFWNHRERIHLVLKRIFNVPEEHDYPFWHFDCILGSPLVLALWSPEALRRMLDHGYRPDRLTMSVAAGLYDSEALQTLVQYPKLLGGFENIHGPVSVAVKRLDLTALNILLDNGEDANENNRSVPIGRSPLQAAVEIGEPGMIDLLLKAGADINTPAADDRGATALQVAAMTGHLGIARKLVELGAVINAAGAKIGGRTVLEDAAEFGNVDPIEYFLTQGAQTTGDGRLQYLRAIRYAERNGHIIAANQLRVYREWTQDDHTLWGKLRSLTKKECEEYREEAVENESLDKPGIGQQPSKRQSMNYIEHDLLMEDLVASQMDDSSVGMSTPSITSADFTELEDLEVLTRDNFEFWSGA